MYAHTLQKPLCIPYALRLLSHFRNEKLFQKMKIWRNKKIAIIEVKLISHS